MEKWIKTKVSWSTQEAPSLGLFRWRWIWWGPPSWVPRCPGANRTLTKFLVLPILCSPVKELIPLNLVSYRSKKFWTSCPDPLHFLLLYCPTPFLQRESWHKCPHPRREFQRQTISAVFFLSARRCSSKPLCLISDVNKTVLLNHFNSVVQCRASNFLKSNVNFFCQSLILDSLSHLKDLSGCLSGQTLKPNPDVAVKLSGVSHPSGPEPTQKQWKILLILKNSSLKISTATSHLPESYPDVINLLQLVIPSF